MELIRWNPMRDMFSFRHQMNHLFDDVFGSVVRGDSGLSMWNRYPTVDIYDNDENIIIKAELPGIDKKDIVIDVKDGVLTLKGERSSDKEVKEENFYRKESFSGTFQRVFTLPMEVESEKIKAEYKDGILKIEVPKPEAEKPKEVAIN